MRLVYIPGLREIVFHEALHASRPDRPLRCTIENLHVHAWEVVVWVRVELALKFSVRIDLYLGFVRIWVRFVSRQAINSGIFFLTAFHDEAQSPKHVIKRTVFHHQNDKVL